MFFKKIPLKGFIKVTLFSVKNFFIICEILLDFS